MLLRPKQLPVRRVSFRKSRVDTICQRCGKIITRRMKANVWAGREVVCTGWRDVLQGVVVRRQVAYDLAGKPDAGWIAYDGQQQYGPFTAEQMIEMLGAGQVDWLWQFWRDGMNAWTPAARLFVTAQLGGGRIELRDSAKVTAPTTLDRC